MNPFVHMTWSHVLSKQVVRLNFGKFDVSHGVACHFDYVAVYDGPSADEGTQIARACGYRPPGWVAVMFMQTNHNRIQRE